jgi:hypothetical protein
VEIRGKKMVFNVADNSGHRDTPMCAWLVDCPRYVETGKQVPCLRCPAADFNGFAHSEVLTRHDVITILNKVSRR